MDSPTAQMDSLRRGTFLQNAPSAPSNGGTRNEEVFNATLALWRERLAAEWTPPENSGFPWAQVKRSLAALVAETSEPSPRVSLRSLAPLPRKPFVPQGEEGFTARENREAPLSAMEPSTPLPARPPSEIGKRGVSEERAHGEMATSGPTPVLALICAGNTPLLAWPAMLFAVKHGVPIFVKMSRDETLWPQLLKDSIAEVDPEAGARIICEVWPGEDPRTEELIFQADAVIAYGSDATIERLKALAGEKPFLGFGHAVSIGIATGPVSKKNDFDDSYLAGFAKDILTFDQSGCLSPHLILVQNPKDLTLLRSELLPRFVERLDIPPRTSFEEAALVRSWRAMAALQGAEVWGDDELRWTIVEWKTPQPFSLIPCPGLVQVMPFNPMQDWLSLLEPVKGQLSCLGRGTGAIRWIANGKVYREEELFSALARLGISRVCKAGEMQTPPLDWKNGGVDLEAWIANLER